MLRILAMLCGLMWLAPALAGQAELLDALRRSGHILLLRHAVTEPGLGDPQNFVLGDCATQRNLSAAGRVQARALGQWLRTQGIPVGEVRSSQWCRCLDTARLAFAPELEIQPWPALNSFFGDRGREPKQRAEVLAALAPRMEANRVWVTHQVNITSLTGVFPAMGEIVVIRPGAQGLEVVGRFVPG